MTILDNKPFKYAEKLVSLTVEDIESFAVNGYVVKRGVLDKHLMRNAENLMWNSLGQSFDRDDPETWHGDAKDCLGTIPISDRYGTVKLRDEIWGDNALDALLTRNPVLFSMVESLLGTGNVLPPERSRGIYPTFPAPEHAHIPVHAHVDLPKRAFKVGVVAYLGDVPKGGGGFAVWPGSHRALFFKCKRDASSPANRTKRAFGKMFNEFDAHEPLEITGGPGDVILFHHLLMHASTINTIEGHVRKAAFCNFATPNCAAQQIRTRPHYIWHDWHGINAIRTPAIRASRTPAPAEAFARPRSIPAHSATVDKMLRGARKLSLGMKFRRVLPEWIG